jgi:ABC-type branched-subunit amino acid transport system ATPase component
MINDWRAIFAGLVDRVVLLDQGRVLDGDPADCRNSPQMRIVYCGQVDGNE